MNLSSAADLKSALTVILLWTSIWLVVSIPAWIAKQTLDGLGLLTLPGRALQLAGRLGLAGGGVGVFLQRAGAAMHAGDGAVRIYLDERQRRLRESIASSERAVRLACQSIDDLTRDGGPTPIMDEVRALQEATRKAASMGGEITDNIEDEYAARGKALLNTCILFVAGAVLVAFNGTLLGLFFDGLIPGQTFGVKHSLVAGMAAVFVELVLGYALADVASEEEEEAEARAGAGGGSWGQWVLIGGLILAAVFEAVVLGIVSHGFELESELFDAFPILTYWMAIVGVFFVIGSSFAGLRFHRHLDRYMSLRGALHLKRELKGVNAYTVGLPAAWEAVTKAARQAEHSIENYHRALGDSSGVLDGAVDQLEHERDALIAAFRDARVDQWPDVLQARPADIRWAAIQNVALLFFTVVGVAAYITAVAFFATTDLGTGVPGATGWALAAAVATAFYVLGFLPFGRVQVGQGTSGRVFPLRPGRFEYAAAGVVAFLLAVGLVWLTARALDGWGAMVGLILFAAGGLVSVAGYVAERAAAGLALLGALSVALAAALFVTLYNLASTAVLAGVAGIVLALNLALSLMAAPIYMAVRAYKTTRAEHAAPAAGGAVVEESRAA
jgi:hypothetical protein